MRFTYIAPAKSVFASINLPSRREGVQETPQVRERPAISSTIPEKLRRMSGRITARFINEPNGPYFMA